MPVMEECPLCGCICGECSCSTGKKSEHTKECQDHVLGSFFDGHSEHSEGMNIK